MEYQVLAGVDVQPTVLRLAEDLAPNMIRPVKDPKEKNCLIGQADHLILWIKYKKPLNNI